MSTIIVVFAASAVFGAIPDDNLLLKPWRERMAKTATLLEAKDYRAALRLANQAVSDMVEHLGPGEGAVKWLTVTLTHKALAHAGLGEIDEAIWYWDVAMALYPRVAETDLSSFGEAGALLKAHAAPAAPEGTTQKPPPNAPITPPKIIRHVEPQFPRGAADFSVGGTLIVQAVIMTNGRLRSPRILQPLEAPTLSYAALEAMKHWQFEPGKVNNEPVEVFYNLTVNYKPRR